MGLLRNTMLLERYIGYKIIVVVAIVTALALFFTGLFYSKYQQHNIYQQNQRTMLKLTESVIQGLESIMVTGYADVANVFATRLKNVADVHDFRIMRTNGLEAFRDNKTIFAVNQRKGEELFIPRDKEQKIPVLLPDHPELLRVLERAETISYQEITSTGESFLTFLAPIKNNKACKECHGNEEHIRGVLKFTSSLHPIKRDIRETRNTAFILMAIALVLILFIVGVYLYRAVIRPIDKVTRAMDKAAAGNFIQQVPVFGKDELGRMAGSFNIMTGELQRTYEGLKNEQDKLSTIILSAREGIVVTDRDHNIVLVNPAAERLLGKPVAQLVKEGFSNIIDDPNKVIAWMSTAPKNVEAEQVEYNNLILNIYAATIQSASGTVVGSAALIRDVTEEKWLEAELRRLSSTDGLTGLYNRRFLDQTLAGEIERSNRYKIPLSILMFDVDHFKRFNDTYGHDQGDRVLKAISREMQQTFRKVDFSCRYGGEEFVVILPETGAEGALILADRLLSNIALMEVDGLKVTISIGVASTPPLSTSTAEHFIEAADKALYQAKDSGRNCVVVAQSITDH